MRILIAFLMIFVFTIRINAQTNFQIAENELLVYTKIIDGQKTFVSRIADEITTYTLSPNQCGRISPDGKYLALSSQEADVLDIIYLPSQLIVFQITWQEDWYPCSAYWYSPNILYTYTLANDGSLHYFEFNNMTLSEIATQLYHLFHPYQTISQIW